MSVGERDGRAALGQLVPALVAGIPALLDDVGQALAEEWPDYAEFLVAQRTEVAGAAEVVMQHLVDLAELSQDGPTRPSFGVGGEQDTELALFDEIGRQQWREGRQLTALMSAYQVGARLAWRHVSATALWVGVAPDGVAALAEAVFLFVDQLSSASARGYVEEQSETAAARERLRDELAELLLSDRSDTAAVRMAAAQVAWPLPKEAAVIFVEPENVFGRTVLSRLDSSCLRVRRPGLLGAIVPDPAGPGRRTRIAAALRGSSAVVGPSVSLEHLPASVGIAEVAARLQRDGILRDDPVFVDEHLDAIIVHRDARLLEALRRQCLAPLRTLPSSSHQRLEETLTSWLRHMGDRQAVAAELHVHPQTVRYRVRQLRDAFGDALDDPVSRARLTLALAWDPVGPPGAGRAG